MQLFYIYAPETHCWLGDDEHRWTSEIDEAAAFTDQELAQAIACRETATTKAMPLVFSLDT